jgi:hypothetical protein
MRPIRLLPAFILILFVTSCRPLPAAGLQTSDTPPAVASPSAAPQQAKAPLTEEAPTPGVLAASSLPSKPSPTPGAELPAQAPTSAASLPRDCPVPLTGGLITEIKAILEAMPGPDSEGMLIPSDTQMVAWEYLVRSISEGNLEAACQILEAFEFPYSLVDFTDLPADQARYLLLKEDLPITLGWGTYVIRSATAQADVVIQVPHPLADDRTALQGADLFRQLEARALMLAGTHRCANANYSPCSGMTVACGPLEPYRTSDVAHGVQTAFQAAHQALLPCGGGTVAIQLHGNGLADCPDLFISNGSLHPRSTTLELYDSAARHCGSYSVDLADGADGECAFNGGAAVQAVYSNGCGLNPPVDACIGYAQWASNPEGFIFLEQSIGMREEYGCLVEALEEVVGER